MNNRMTRPTPDPVCILRGIQHPITAACFGVDFHGNSCLILGDSDKTVGFWNLETRRVEGSLKINDACLWLGFIESEKVVLVQTKAGRVESWRYNGSDWLVHRGIDCANIGFCKCRLVTYESKLCLAVPDKCEYTVVLCEPLSLSIKARILHKETVGTEKYGIAMCVADVGEWEYLVVGYENGYVILCDMKRDCILDRKRMYSEPIMCVAHGNGVGLAGSVDDNVVVWSVSNDAIVELRRIVIKNPGVNDVCIRGDGKLFAVACWDGTARLFSVKSLKALAVLMSHSASINCAVFRDDGLLAVASNDCTSSLWHLYR